jgi:hypothetical protein
MKNPACAAVKRIMAGQVICPNPLRSLLLSIIAVHVLLHSQADELRKFKARREAD